MTRWLLALLAALSFARTAQAVDEADLLPIDEAFALTATATERGRIELHWEIADGYYLYRHRMGAELLSPGFKVNPLELPDGIAYTDEFFGDVETYRGDVTGVLTGAAAHQQDRQVVPGVAVAGGDARAVEDRHVIEQRPVAVGRRPQLRQVLREQLGVIPVDLRHPGHQIGHIAVMRQRVVRLGCTAC